MELQKIWSEYWLDRACEEIGFEIKDTHSFMGIVLSLTLGYTFDMLPKIEEWNFKFFLILGVVSWVFAAMFTIVCSIYKIRKWLELNRPAFETAKIKLKEAVSQLEANKAEIEQEMNAPVHEEFKFFKDKQKQQ